MTNEIKKQLVKSKRLKTYFEEHQTEKEVILKSIEDEADIDYQFKHLEFIPSYAMPLAVIKNNAEESKIANTPNYMHSLLQNINYLPKQEEDHFEYEDPENMNVEKLAFLSGKKLWQLKHKKRIRKGL